MTNMSQTSGKIKIRVVLVLLILSILTYLYNNRSDERKPLEKSASVAPLATEKPSPVVNIKSAAPAKKKCLINNTCQLAKKRPTPQKKIAIQKKINTPFVFRQAHQCKIEVDEDFKQLVNDAVEELKIDTELKKYTYHLNSFLTLNILSAKMSADFWKTLAERLKVVIHLYDKTFSLKFYEHRDINLIILPDREEYLDLLTNLSIDGTNSQGLYWQASNFAFVEYKNDKQVLQTSVHESIHTINNFLVGASARWVNEGLAEYFERITVSNNKYSFMTKDYSDHEIPLDIYTLVNSNQQWSSYLRQNLYASAFMHIAYFFDNSTEESILYKILQEEKKSPCSTLQDEHYLSIIEDEILFNSPESFDDWYNNKLE